MKTLFIALMVVGLSFASCPAVEAANWVLTGTSEDGNASLYVDRESISAGPSNMIKAWTKFLFGNPEPFESKFFSQMSVHMEYDCNEGRSKMLEMIFIYTDGSQESFTVDKDWHSVKPGTLEGESYQYLCGKSS